MIEKVMTWDIIVRYLSRKNQKNARTKSQATARKKTQSDNPKVSDESSDICLTEDVYGPILVCGLENALSSGAASDHIGFHT